MIEVHDLVTRQLNRGLDADAGATKPTQRLLRHCILKAASACERLCPLVIEARGNIHYGPQVRPAMSGSPSSPRTPPSGGRAGNASRYPVGCGIDEFWQQSRGERPHENGSLNSRFNLLCGGFGHLPRLVREQHERLAPIGSDVEPVSAVCNVHAP
jgi:hypothetical protein